MENIKNLPVNLINPHPNNPRKDLGDLTELSASIKENGILQNLTVVPDGEKYTVIIGHRRLSASKQAGLDEVPCVIVEMDEKEQLRTMLMENMQRNDLTVYEQAQGFQMMMDLGCTLSEIAKDSGFSTATVKHRVRLLELDNEKFKKSQERGATIFDYIKLEKVTDPEAKNSLLDFIGTKDFDYKLKTALDDQEFKGGCAKNIELVSSFAKEVEKVDYSSMSCISLYSRWNMHDIKKPEDAETGEYFFHVTDNTVGLYKKRKTENSMPTEDPELKAEKEAAKLRIKKADSMLENFLDLHREFLEAAAPDFKKHQKIIFKTIIILLFGEDSNCCDIDCDELAKYLEIEVYDGGYSEWKELWKSFDKNPLRVLLCTVLSCSRLSSYSYGSGMHGGVWKGGYYEVAPEVNDIYTTVLSMLEEMGYIKSSEEEAYVDGTHEIFKESLDVFE